MSCVEADNVNVHHRAWIVHTELEPVVVSEVGIESLESTAIILLVEVSIIDLSNRVMCDVGFPIHIRSFDYPSVVRCRKVKCCIRT